MNEMEIRVIGTLVETEAPFLGSVTTRKSYSVGGDSSACEWKWLDDKPHWQMSSKEELRWYLDGELSEYGRQQILEHFGLQQMANALPLEVLSATSPQELMGMRRRLETQQKLTKLFPKSTRCGDHISPDDID